MSKSYEAIQRDRVLEILGGVYAVPGSRQVRSRTQRAAARVLIGDYARALGLVGEVEGILREVPAERLTVDARERLAVDFATLREILGTLIEREDELRAA